MFLHRSRALRRAYSLSEMLVALTIGVTVAAGVFWGLSKWNQMSQAEAQRIKFLKSVMSLRDMIADDVKVALVNNSTSAGLGLAATTPTDDPNHLAGISTFRKTAESDPVLQIFRPFHEELSIPVSVNSSSVVASGLHSAPAASNQSELRYFWNAQAVGAFFSVSNFRNTLIFRNDNPVALPGGGGGTFRSSTSLDSAAFANSPAILRTAERVTYRTDSNSNLIRESLFRRTKGKLSNQSTVIAENVFDFRVGLTFEDRLREGIVLPFGSDSIERTRSATELPESYDEAWRNPCNSTFENPSCPVRCYANDSSPVSSSGLISPLCPKPKDVAGVAIQLRMLTDLPRDVVSVDRSNAFGSFRYSFGLLNPSDRQSPVVATIDFYLEAESHRRIAGDDTVQGASGSCLNAEQSRCKPECSEVFTSLDFNSPWWVGYGRHKDHPNPSSFCLGWQRNADIGAWDRLPSYQNAPLRWDALAKHYGCVWSILVGHPGYRLACHCLRGGPTGNEPWYLPPLNAQNRPEFTSLTAPETKGYGLINGLERPSSGATPTIPSDLEGLTNPLHPALRCKAHYDPPLISCSAAARSYFNLPAEPSSWEQRCRCLTTEIPYLCDLRDPSASSNCQNDSTQTEINWTTVRFREVCNFEHRRDPTRPLSCPNTWFATAPSGGSSPPALTIGTKSFPMSFWTSDFVAGLGSQGRSFSPYNPADRSGGVYNTNRSSSLGFAAKFAITPRIAEACECLENHIRGRYDNSSFTPLDVPEYNDRFLRWPHGQNIDVRVTMDQTTTPPLPEGFPVNASNQSRPVATLQLSTSTWRNISPTDGGCTQNASGIWSCERFSNCTVGDEVNGIYCWVGSEMGIDRVNGPTCSRALCRMGHNLSCCQYSDDTHVDVLAEYSQWKGYCSSGCSSSSWSPFFNTEHRRVRELITGTPPGGRLPSTCGGGGGNPGPSGPSSVLGY